MMMTTMNDDDDRPVRNKNIENNVPHSEQLDPAKAAASAELQANAQGLVNSMAKEGKPLDKHYDEFIEKMEDQRSKHPAQTGSPVSPGISLAGVRKNDRRTVG